MLDIVLILFLFLLAAAAFCRSIYSLRQGSLDFIPTIGWILCMVVPFIFEWFFLKSSVKYTHFTGLTLFTVTFFASDWISTTIISRKKDYSYTPQTLQINQSIAIGFAVVSIALIITHLSLTPNIPLLEMLAHKEGNAIELENRNNYYRDFTSFWILPYILNFNIFLFGIPSLIYFMQQKRWAVSSVLLCIFVLYAVSGNAKSQFVIIMTQLILVSVYMLPNAQRYLIKLFYTGFAVFISLCAYNAVVIKHDIIDAPAPTAAIVNVPDNHIGDYYRMSDTFMKREGLMILRNPDVQMRYYFYRCVITPVEVSARWYEYFHEFPVTKISFSQKIADSRSGTLTHPSNAVGRWAYAERFPTHYYPFMHAYASMDADSYGRYGTTGWILAAVLYIILRISLAFFYDHRSTFRRILYGSGLIIIGSISPSSSIQALLLPNGLGAILLTMAILYFIEKRIWNEQRLLAQTS